MNYKQEDFLPSNRNYIIFGGCLTFILTLILLIITISAIRPVVETEKISVSVQQTTPSADISKYNQDSDQDLLPNFVEDEAILNTFVPETTYCEQSNPVCSQNPFENTFNISILIDSSTSMNIPAKERLSKIELVKKELNVVLNESLFENYTKLQLVGFGNKGNLSFIADNESCVSSYTFKNFQQNLKSVDTNPLVLENLVANGKSPIGYSLEQIEKSFPDKNQNNLVIIITDGNDDCGGDLNTTFRNVLARGVIKKINLIALYAPQDENQKLRDATESNGGKYTASDSVFSTVSEWKKDFIFTNWCKYQNQNKVFQCLDKNYNSAFNILENQIKEGTPSNEINKIKEIKSSADLLLQNYRSREITKLKEEFDSRLKDLRD